MTTTEPTPMHYCGRELHDGDAKVAATWMIRQAVGVEGSSADHSLSAALVPSAGDRSIFCCCDEHLEHTLNNYFTTDKFIVRRVARRKS